MAERGKASKKVGSNRGDENLDPVLGKGQEGDRGAPDFASEAGDAYSSGDWARAVALTDQALDANENDVHALFIRSGALLELGEIEDFFSAIDRVIDLDPDAIDPLVVKALVLVSLERDLPLAVELAKKATSKQPDDPDTWDALSEAYFADGQVSDAVIASQKAVALPEAKPSHYLLLHRAASANGEAALAADTLDAALSNHPDDTGALTAKAFELSELGDRSRARELIDHAFEVDPTSADVLRARGAIVGGQGEYELAAEMFDAVLDLDPSDEIGWLGSGLAYRSADEPDRALTAYQRAMEIDPSNPSIQRGLGWAYLDLDSYRDALQVFGDLSKVDPSDGVAWYGKGIAERLLGFPSDSIDSLRKALAIGSFEDPADWKELGRSYSAAGLHRNAWRAFTEALRLAPGDIDAGIGIAVESIWEHQDARALKELSAAERSCGQAALIEYNRGVAHHRLGHREQACDAWRRAHRLDEELTAAKVLVESFTEESRLGGWADHWFGSQSSGWRKVGGMGLIVALFLFLLVPVLEPSLIPGIETGTQSVTSYVPAFAVLFLLVLPTVRGFAVGNVQLDVSPISSPGALSPPIDPEQIIPMFQRTDLDIRELIRG